MRRHKSQQSTLYGLADFQSVNINHRTNKDRKATTSHCAPVSVNTPGSSANSGSGCVCLLHGDPEVLNTVGKHKAQPITQQQITKHSNIKLCRKGRNRVTDRDCR